MNRLLEISQTPKPDSESRTAAIRENTKHWLSVDYEAISAALEIEINTEMSPLVITKVVSARLSEMSKTEREDIPSFIWECLGALDVTGLGKFSNHHPDNARNNLVPFNIRKVSGDTVVLQARGIDVGVFMAELGKQPRWELWCSVHQPKVSFDPLQGGPTVQSEQFIPWAEGELETIFGNFYAAE